MPTYHCPRCGYKTTIKTHINNHLNRKFICDHKLHNYTIEECKELIFGINNIKNNSNENTKKNDSKMTPNDSFDSFYPVLKMTPSDSFFSKNDSFLSKNDSFSENIETAEKKEKKEKNSNYECIYCGKSFSKNSNLCRHIRICKIKPEEETYEVAINKIRGNEKEDKNITKKVEEIKSQIENMFSDSNITSINNNINNIQNIQGDQVNIYINAFGEEKLDYITDKIISKLITRSPMRAVPNLLQHIHFHPNHSENHNIYIPNKKQPLAKIYNGKNWIYTQKKEIIENMANKALSIIEESEDIVNIKNNYYNGDKKTINKIHDDTEIMILNEGKHINK